MILGSVCQGEFFTYFSWAIFHLRELYAGLKFHIRTKPYKALFEDIRKGNKIPTNLEFDLKMNDTEISVETEIEISSADFKDKKDIRVCARLI